MGVTLCMRARLPPADAEEVSLAEFVPATAQTVTLRVKIHPMRGSVLIYRSLYDTKPVRCDGPTRTITIGYGAGKIYVEKTHGASYCTFEFLGSN